MRLPGWALIQYDGVLIRKEQLGTSLEVQWPRLHILTAGGLHSNPGQGTRSRMLQLRVHVLN